jgi:toxin CcdB
MARFDLHRRASGGYLFDVQSNLITGLGTRIAVPLLPLEVVPPPTRRLHPVFNIEGHAYVMATHLMAGVPTRALGPVVSSLDDHYDEIVAAVDMVFVGF